MADELADGLWRIRCTGVNAYLLQADELVLVDAGTPIDAGAIGRGVADAGHALADVDRVLVTHFDLDHVGALWRLDDELVGPVHMAEPDRGYLTREASPPPSSKGAMQHLFRLFARPPALDVRPVTDGESIGGVTAYRTPGHTPGHAVYANDAVGFLGDLAVESDGALAVPPGLLNYETDEVEASIRTFADRGPDFDVAAIGHGEPLSSGGARALDGLADGL
jgi:glyoxylase-like metal-dependent hydrolase (beta-lactamase superfamily II)